ncbi:MAG TPA: hypothetical protein VHS31_03095 [Tepidisphaeraceae bacterium]|nr:hypothetical protein [Tepidisphaeraceae bacterium]
MANRLKTICGKLGSFQPCPTRPRMWFLPINAQRFVRKYSDRRSKIAHFSLVDNFLQSQAHNAGNAHHVMVTQYAALGLRDGFSETQPGIFGAQDRLSEMQDKFFGALDQSSEPQPGISELRPGNIGFESERGILE